MSNNIVIIAAAGKGTRIGSSLPKQYHLLDSKPVLMHTIEAFAGHVQQIIIAIHPEMITFWKQLCQQYQFDIPHELVHGGHSRFQSVKNALTFLKINHPETINKNTAIAVHDAARPLIDQHLIEKAFAYCHNGDSNVLAVRSSNSVRIGTTEHSNTVDRTQVWLIQTPQTFPADILCRAFEQDEQSYFTDESVVVEKLGYSVRIIESTPKNLKITLPEDFAIAQFYLQDHT